jgi:hypothetical protein
VRTHGPLKCMVDVSPGEVDVGAVLAVTVQASCHEGCDLTGRSVSIRAEDGGELAAAELARGNGAGADADGAAYVATFDLQAPPDVGAHTWRAVLPAHEKDGVSHEEASTTFASVTKAHSAHVNVWGMPSAIPAGERFAFKVGIKCSAGCGLAGRQLTIFDHEGAQAAATRLGDDVWPGTDALYFAEVEAQAPYATGYHEWRIDMPESERGLPHAGGVCTLRINVVSPPDHEVTIEAFDAATRAPISGAHVLLHPYRTHTDENGVAKIKVAKGKYRLFVSGFNYIAYQGVIDVAGDLTTRAELAVEPEGQEDYR